VVVVVLAVLAALLAACGVPNDGEPRGVASGDAPAALLATSTTQPPVVEETGPEVTAVTPNAPPITVFLVIAGQDRVYPVERRADPPAADVLDRAQAAADTLLQTLLGPELQAGYTTTLTTTTIRCLRVSDDGTLDIEVTQLPRVLADQPLAMAQIVLTLVRVEGVRRVRVYRQGGDLFNVPLWVGGETQPGATVDASDYYGAIGSRPAPDATSTTTTTAAATTTAVPAETTAPPPTEQTPESGPAPPAEEGAS